jgi:hypothetical protein
MRRERSLIPRTDWFRVLADLQYAECSNTDVAEYIGVPQTTLLGWKQGSEPRHHDGQRLLELWAMVTGGTFEARPMTQPLPRTGRRSA